MFDSLPYCEVLLFLLLLLIHLVYHGHHQHSCLHRIHIITFCLCFLIVCFIVFADCLSLNFKNFMFDLFARLK